MNHESWKHVGWKKSSVTETTKESQFKITFKRCRMVKPTHTKINKESLKA